MLIELSKKQLRIVELVMVLSLAILPGFLSALFNYLGYIKYDYTTGNVQINYILQIVQQLLVLVVFFYVLYRQGRSLEFIGLDFSWRDFYRGFALLLIFYGVNFFINRIINIVTLLAGGDIINKLPDNIEMFSQGPIGLITIVFIIVNSLYEEIVIRAYFISEVKDMSGSSVLAVTLCVLLMTSYHIYQGLLPLISIATIFLVFSIYYVKKKRIMPVIIAHSYMNLISFIAVRYLSNLI